MKNVGLVFAGGGVKGSYQIGVWKALKEMDIDIKSVVGTSIGSINGALFAMGEYDKALKLWSEITIEDIIKMDAQSENLFDMKNMMVLINDICRNSGIDASPLHDLLKKIVDEDKVRSSDIDYGLVTYSLTDKKEISLFKNDIPRGKLVEYIMASACLPVFKNQKIDDKVFIDGAVNNNIPIDLLIDKGVQNIIAVDVGGIGVVKNVNTLGVNIFTVKCSENVLGMMEFNPENIRKSIKMGYYDCNKAFGRLMGEKYYFNTGDYVKAKRKYSAEILQGMELAAAAFGINNLAVYKMDDFKEGIIKGYRHAKYRYKELLLTIHINILDIVGGLMTCDDALIIAWMVDQMEKKNFSFINNKIVSSVMNNNVTAASAVLYLIRE